MRFWIIGGIITGLLAAFVALNSFHHTPNLPTQEPASAIVITAPKEVEVGELVILDVGGSDASTFKWKVVPETLDFLVIDNGKRAVFSSRTPGEYMFILAGAKGDQAGLAIHTVKVKGEVKPGEANLKDQITSWADKITTTNKKNESLKLSSSFASVATVAKNGQLDSVDAILEATTVSNRESLGASAENWRPFFEQFSLELKARDEAGKLPDPASYIQMWNEVAQNLEAYSTQLE